MIFGFGKGKIKVLIDNFNFSPGETVSGKISVELKKPILAKQLKIGLIGLETSTRTQMGPGFGIGGRRRSGISHQRTRNTVYSFYMPVGGEKEYSKGEYQFEIKIPTDILQEKPKAAEGVGGALIKTAEILGGTVRSRVDWYLEAALDLEKKLDIKNKVQINIG